MVGSALERQLRAAGYNTLVTRTMEELDLRRQAEVEAFFSVERPVVVFLAAARVGGIHANSSFPAEFIYDNLLIAANVIHAAWQSGTERLINFGSSCIYPRLAPQPLKEEYLLGGYLEPTNEPYALAKIAALRMCSYYNRQYGTRFSSLMPTNLYGSNDSYDLEASHVLPALIRKFILADALRRGDWQTVQRDLSLRALTKQLDLRASVGRPGREELTEVLGRFNITAEAVTLWGTGSPRREFLHVDDAASAALFLLENPLPPEYGDFVNAGTGVDLTIAELAGLVREAAGFTGEIRFDREHPDGTPQKLLDVSRLQQSGWRARIALEDGIGQTVEEYRAALLAGG